MGVRHAPRDHPGFGSRHLSAEPALREIWRKRIGAEGFKVGVVWQGNPNPEADRARSMPVTGRRCSAASRV